MSTATQAIEKSETSVPPDIGPSAESAKLCEMQPANVPQAGVYCGIFCTAAAVLLLELALTRVFAVMLWAHLAFMVVGTALFGFGLSGVYLALRQPTQPKDLRPRLSILSFVMTLAMLGCYLVVNHVPFRMWAFNEDPLNFLYLAVWYIALVIPFFIAGLIIALLLGFYRDHCSRLYGIDLIGAATGSLLLIPIIPLFGAEGTVVSAALLAAVAGLAYAPREKWFLRSVFVLTICLLGLLVPKADEAMSINFHQTKRRFNKALINKNVFQTRWSPLSRVDLAYHRRGAFDLWIDGGTNESVIIEWSGNMDRLRRQTWSTIGTAFDLKRGTEPKVMIIGPAGGKEVLFALSHEAGHVDAVEMDPSIVELVLEPKYAKYMGHLYTNEKVRLYNDEGRSFLRRQPKSHYDIIQSVNNYTPVAMTAGALNLSAAFLMTKEAFNDYLDHLTPNGIVALHRGATLRIAVTALEVLAERGMEDPKSHILITSGEVPYFDGFFLKKSPWTQEEVEKIDDFLKGRLLQNRRLLWNPFEPEQPGIYQTVMLTPPEELGKYYTSLGINLFPPTDNRPFMEHFLRFGSRPLAPELPDEFKDRNAEKWRGIIPRGDFPYLAILAESAVLAMLFVCVPLLVFARSSITHPFFKGFLSYFSALGFGFIVIEICLMKRYVLFLGNPAYSITTVLVVLLCGAGLGSMASSKLGNRNPQKALTIIIPLLVGAVLLETLISPILFQKFLAMEFGARVMLASLFLLPLGFIMGMPFPLGLRLINITSPNEVERQKITAWAWGMNGYCTVIGSAATVFIAVFAGFKAALIAAAAVYLLGLLSIRGIVRK